jgi:hypothetical protein
MGALTNGGQIGRKVAGANACEYARSGSCVVAGNSPNTASITHTIFQRYSNHLDFKRLCLVARELLQFLQWYLRKLPLFSGGWIP